MEEVLMRSRQLIKRSKLDDHPWKIDVFGVKGTVVQTYIRGGGMELCLDFPSYFVTRYDIPCAPEVLEKMCDAFEKELDNA